jgi:hypothetical protein
VVDRTDYSRTVAAAGAGAVVVAIHCICHLEELLRILVHCVDVWEEFVLWERFLVANVLLGYTLDILNYRLVHCYCQLHHDIVIVLLISMLLGNCGTFGRVYGTCRQRVSASFVPKTQIRL